MEDQQEYGLTQEEKMERDPAAIQRELLSLDDQLLEAMPRLEAKNKIFQEARADFEVERLRIKLIKDRRSPLQSVLKSLK